ncbi:fumarylacetoacetate hydrolase family protein [Hyphomicrobium sp. CS1GBMeth3]|uniref:fumarylacetoacetate hydrolase family protein n=1 Tax=Hyphomicrobium sp. CS1GBMeth3 TaxID=1892845 RepID=UPI0009313EE2|nr:fumarylacetoacetate hydrolase family protein [Hyphomicrobium sp. CS1GBMeth3]
MKLRRVSNGATSRLQIAVTDGWVDMARALESLGSEISDENARRWSEDVVALLAAPADVRARLATVAASLTLSEDDGHTPTLPFAPRSFRDFMLYESHAIDAARGFVRSFLPRAWGIVRAYEAVLGPPFPPLKPHRLWYRQPIYYMGNHLAFVSDGDVVLPSYTRALDYELELGFVLARELYDADPAEAEAAIGGFVVVNDFSARDVQHDEMRSGFGPQKAKHFCNGMSAIMVSADEILPRWRDLNGFVRINGKLIATPSSADPPWSLGEALAHASRSERLRPGELFATGTLPGGSGIETGRLLAVGDVVEIGIEGIGTLTNRIVDKDGRTA